MPKQKDIEHLKTSDIAVILTYLLEIKISASNVYNVLLQLGLITKDKMTSNWILTDAGRKLAQEIPYTDKATRKERTYFVWHRDVVEQLKQHIEILNKEKEGIKYE